MNDALDHLDEQTLNLYLDDRLSDPVRLRIDTHLGTCAPCRQRVEQYLFLFDELLLLPELPLERDLSPAVLAALAPAPPLPARLTTTLVLQLLAALALLPLIWNLAAAEGLRLARGWIAAGAEPVGRLWGQGVDSTVRAIGDLATGWSDITTAALPATLSPEWIALLLAAATVLWLAGNRALLRPLRREHGGERQGAQ